MTQTGQPSNRASAVTLRRGPVLADQRNTVPGIERTISMQRRIE